MYYAINLFIITMDLINDNLVYLLSFVWKLSESNWKIQKHNNIRIVYGLQKRTLNGIMVESCLGFAFDWYNRFFVQYCSVYM